MKLIDINLDATLEKYFKSFSFGTLHTHFLKENAKLINRKLLNKMETSELVNHE